MQGEVKPQCVSVTPEQVSGIHLVLHIVQHRVITVGDDTAAHGLEFLYIIYHFTSEERGAVFQTQRRQSRQQRNTASGSRKTSSHN